MGRSNVDTVFPDEDDNRLGLFVLHKGERKVVDSSSWSSKDTGADVHGSTNVEKLQLVCNDGIWSVEIPVFLDIKVDWRRFYIQVTKSSFQCYSNKNS